MESIAASLLKCLPCTKTGPEEASDDDVVDIKANVLCCVKAQKIELDFRDAPDGGEEEEEEGEEDDPSGSL